MKTNQLVIETVSEFKQKGVLKQKDNGYLYLEVSRDCIADVLPLIEAQGKIVPPRHYTSKKGIGATNGYTSLRKAQVEVIGRVF